MRLKQNKNIEALTTEGYKSFDGVRRLPKKQKTLKFYFEDETSLIVTPNHIFTVDYDFEVEAKHLKIGDYLQSINKKKKIVKITKSSKKVWVYDLLDVKSKNNSYFTNDILSHNCQFLGSNSTLVDPDVLERMETKQPIDYMMGYLFSIWERPIPGVKYILSVDSAKGTGKDFSVIQVVKVLTKTKIEQVAVYRCNTISTHDFAEVIIQVSEMYWQAEIMLENNDVGSSVAECLWFFWEYDKILNCDPKGLGIRSTRKTKLQGNLLLKKYLENGWLKINCDLTKQELSRYVEETGKASCFAAEAGSHDDLVTSLLWNCFYMETPFFDGIDDSGGLVIKDKNKLEEQYPEPVIIQTGSFGPHLDDENGNFLNNGGSFGNQINPYS